FERLTCGDTEAGAERVAPCDDRTADAAKDGHRLEHPARRAAQGRARGCWAAASLRGRAKRSRLLVDGRDASRRGPPAVALLEGVPPRRRYKARHQSASTVKR